MLLLVCMFSFSHVGAHSLGVTCVLFLVLMYPLNGSDMFVSHVPFVVSIYTCPYMCACMRAFMHAYMCLYMCAFVSTLSRRKDEPAAKHTAQDSQTSAQEPNSTKDKLLACRNIL